jgi:hypothetical protein
MFVQLTHTYRPTYPTQQSAFEPLNILLLKGPHTVFSFTISLKREGIRAKLDYKRGPSFYVRNVVCLLFEEDPTPKHNAIKSSELREGTAACTYEQCGC